MLLGRIALLGILLPAFIYSELLPTLVLKPSGSILFKNETETKTSYNRFSLYVRVNQEVMEKQHIITIRSDTRSEQFIKVSLIKMQISVLANLRHPAVSRWFLVGDPLLPKETYFIGVEQVGKKLSVTINNSTTHYSLESVEDFIFPSILVLGNIQTTSGINGSIAGLSYNNVDVLRSYLKRDYDFSNVAVEMGGDVTIKEREWVTIEEREKVYCPHTNHFPKSEVGTEIRLENCPQNIARAVCGDSKIWLVEKCGNDEKSVKGRSGGDSTEDTESLSNNMLIIYIGAGASAALFISVIIIAIVIKRRRRGRVHRYKMAPEDRDNSSNGLRSSFPPQRLDGVLTLPPPLKTDSLTTKKAAYEMSCSTLEYPASDILDNRIPVFTATNNPLSKTEDLYPVYMSAEGNLNRDSDIISTILGEKAERQYTSGYNGFVNSPNLIPSSLLNSNSGLNSEQSSWCDV